jgi:hypothetical protein
MPAIPASLREAIIRRANRRCEYCGLPAGFSSAAFEVEHILSKALRGGDDAGNLALACRGCNSHKATASHGIDPETGEMVRLFHPRLDLWSEHFGWRSNFAEIVGLSPVGRATVTRLRMNREEVTNLRRALVAFGEMPPPGT